MPASVKKNDTAIVRKLENMGGKNIKGSTELRETESHDNSSHKPWPGDALLA